MEITGHKTRSVFDRYHIVDTQDVSHATQQWEAVARQNLLSRTRGSKLGKISRQLSATEGTLLASCLGRFGQ
jgi:hypothetical protein